VTHHPRTVVVTGASDGIGAAAARALAAAGHEVVVVGRNAERTRRVADEAGATAHLADFTDLAQVRALADELLTAHPRIDALVNNAGGLFPELAWTHDDLETTFQVDHLAPFLLTHLLLDRLLASDGPAVVTTSSAAHRVSRLTTADALVLGGRQDERRYVPFRAYADAKLANLLFTRELHRRYHRAGLASAAVHPGGVATSFAGTSHDLFGWFYRSPLGQRVLRTPEQGAADLVRLAGGRPDVDWPSGQYWADGRIARVNHRGDDPTLARVLWERSEELLGLA
jgi:NAD(P)-dependent dehydrogenase (short-subunit alcohol dehydrogenase family)